MSFSLNRNKGISILIVGILLQFLAYNYAYILKLPPCSMHAWRQSDCLSFALNFYNGRGSLSEPCVNNLGSSGTGKCVSDFPVIQYAIGNVWKLTGVSTTLFRVTNVLFLFFGLVFIYRIFLWATYNNYLISILFTLLVNTSNILVYYGCATLSDIHAFGLSCAAIFLFTKWIEKKERKYVFWCALVYTLAVLIKASAAFSFIICMAFYILNQLIDIRAKKNTVKDFLFGLSFFLLPFIIWYIWYSHADAYNKKYSDGFFLVGILPIWDCNSFAECIEILRILLHDKMTEMFHPFILVGILIFSITFTVTFIKKFPLLIVTIWLSLLSFISFILLFYQVFKDHDYYLINMVSIIVIILALLLRITSDNYPDLLKTPMLRNLVLVVVLFFTYITSVKVWGKVSYKEETINSALAFDVEKNKFYGWLEWYDKTRYKIIENPDFKLDEFGITPSDTIICLGDYTINRSLYLLQRVGYTMYNVTFEDIPQFIEQNKPKGLKYIVLIEPDWKYKDLLKPYFKNKLYDNESTSIYSLR